MTMVLGVDPGTTGALALFNTEEQIFLDVWDMPSRERDYGKGLQVDPFVLFELLQYIVAGAETNFVVWIENVGPMPKQGTVSTFNFGHTIGTIHAVLACLGITPYMVHPASWKKQFGLVGSDKNALIAMLVNLAPYMADKLKRVKDHNRADAMAIAIYGSKFM